MKFLVDMNLTPRWVTFLSEAGYSASHWSTIGASSASDSVIMNYAREHGWCVLTHDLDFAAILALTNWDRPSVIQIRANDTAPETIGQAVARALAQSAANIEAGAVLTVEPASLRVRLLPFRGS